MLSARELPLGFREQAGTITWLRLSTNSKQVTKNAGAGKFLVAIHHSAQEHQPGPLQDTPRKTATSDISGMGESEHKGPRRNLREVGLPLRSVQE